MLHNKCKIQELESISKLSALGLKPEVFSRVARIILASYFEATPHDAKIAPGIYAYLGAVRALRDILVPLGWEAESVNNVELVRSPKGDFYITPSSGDKNTGSDGGFPRTQNPKGPEIFGHVRANTRQLSLFPELPSVKSTPRPNAIVWVYLYHIDITKEEIRAELSLPIGISTDGHIEKWQERILLPPVEFESSISLGVEAEEPIEFTEMNIGIRKDGRDI